MLLSKCVRRPSWSLARWSAELPLPSACLQRCQPWPAKSLRPNSWLTARLLPNRARRRSLHMSKFLADGGFLNQCIMKLPAADVAAKLIGWMRDHPDYAEKDWVDCLDDGIS